VTRLRAWSKNLSLIPRKRKTILDSCPPFHLPAWKNSAHIGRIFMKLDIWASVNKSVEKIQVSLIFDKNNGYFTWRRFDIFYDMSLILLRIRNVLDKSCTENQNTHSISINFFIRKSNRLWDHVEKFGGDRRATNDVTIWRIRVACWTSKARCTHAHENAHVPGYPHARKHTYECTQRPISNTYCFSTATKIREGSSMLRYTRWFKYDRD
jgi:hypothetical protein